MKEISISVQSAGDIITNSSSECYTIKSNLPLLLLEDLWNKFLLEHGYIDSEYRFIEPYKGELEYTVKGQTYKDEDGLHLDFPIVCNINEDLYEWLSSIFGKENITFTE